MYIIMTVERRLNKKNKKPRRKIIIYESQDKISKEKKITKKYTSITNKSRHRYNNILKQWVNIGRRVVRAPAVRVHWLSASGAAHAPRWKRARGRSLAPARATTLPRTATTPLPHVGLPSRPQPIGKNRCHRHRYRRWTRRTRVTVLRAAFERHERTGDEHDQPSMPMPPPSPLLELSDESGLAGRHEKTHSAHNFGKNNVFHSWHFNNIKPLWPTHRTTHTRGTYIYYNIFS